MYIFLSKVRLEEEEESKNYMRITPEYFDELFVHVKAQNTKDTSSPKLKLAAKTFKVLL